MNRHLDYIHQNAVKHGWVDSPREWRCSTFQRYVAAGWPAADWGAAEPVVILKGQYGE